ncbi:hypothetical protein PPACK8108_LOCUS6154 [Phakopsora pachyrhizi]|uniref:Uncharacterized protein n=1 Tax=Phakopsora pachyrhizi TaxID=170000 RepID=A0AAV0AQH0_PHAPC|nr:hypothetical protein PPACK8108_LOCUS6154 [Phakopsora pachyrhizi]
MNGTKRSSSSYSQDGSGGGAATVSVTGGTVTGTIPLGSFTLPLPVHSHSDHLHQHSHGLNIPKPVYYTGETTIVAATASDKSNTDGGPLYNGYYSEVARTTKDEKNLPAQPSIALTSSSQQGQVEQSYDNGVEDDSYATVDELRDCYVVAICWAEAKISRSAPLVTKSLATSKRPWAVSAGFGAKDGGRYQRISHFTCLVVMEEGETPRIETRIVKERSKTRYDPDLHQKNLLEVSIHTPSF